MVWIDGLVDDDLSSNGDSNQEHPETLRFQLLLRRGINELHNSIAQEIRKWLQEEVKFSRALRIDQNVKYLRNVNISASLGCVGYM